MFYAVVTAPFQHVEVAHQVGIGVGVRVVQRVAHPGLGGQMNDARKAPLGKECRHAAAVSQIQLLEAEIAMRGETGQTRLLEAHLVVVVQVVDAGDLMTGGQQPLGHMVSDKAGRAGEQYLHGLPVLMLWNIVIGGHGRLIELTA